MEHLLYLCHRIPYPPNKGDKIRSFNLLKNLNKHYHVHLGCFIDDPYDIQYQSSLSAYCESYYCVDLNTTMAKIKGLTALTNQSTPITVPYYRSKKLQRWVHNTVKNFNIQKGFVFSSSMAQYLLTDELAHLRKIIDFVDMDSDKWRQYSEKKSSFQKWIYQREYRTLSDYELRINSAYDGSLFVSPEEASLFKEQVANQDQSKVGSLLNGVDTEYFDPGADFESAEHIPDDNIIVFTGAMDYWANEDAVVWFSAHIWPQLYRQHPEYRFYIVGGNPTPKVQRLANTPGIVVTGRVEDVRPYVNRARFAIAPLQIARGIQNKVLEAMAMNKAVVATPMAMEGIPYSPDLDIDVEETDQGFTSVCLARMSGEEYFPPIHSNRKWIQNNFSWESTLAELPTLISGDRNSPV